MNERFDERLVEFVRGVQAMAAEGVIIETVPGRRYVKLVERDDSIQLRCVHCFVDRKNGDVLKAATWRAPAKHARGNIFNEDRGLGGVTRHGAKYLR